MDLIDRQAVIRWIKTECNPYGKPTIEFESGKRVIKYLERMPSVQPEWKVGEWIFVHPLQDNDIKACMCSVCQHGDFDILPSVYKFCPYCGAKMEGKQHE